MGHWWPLALYNAILGASFTLIWGSLAIIESGRSALDSKPFSAVKTLLRVEAILFTSLATLFLIWASLGTGG